MAVALSFPDPFVVVSIIKLLLCFPFLRVHGLFLWFFSSEILFAIFVRRVDSGLPVTLPAPYFFLTRWHSVFFDVSDAGGSHPTSMRRSRFASLPLLKTFPPGFPQGFFGQRCRTCVILYNPSKAHVALPPKPLSPPARFPVKNAPRVPK